MTHCDRCFCLVQDKPNDFQIGMDVFPAKVFHTAPEWFDAVCWGHISPLAHEVIAANAMHLFEQKQFSAAFDLTCTGMAGKPTDALHYLAVYREVIGCSELAGKDHMIRCWELVLSLARLCR